MEDEEEMTIVKSKKNKTDEDQDKQNAKDNLEENTKSKSISRRGRVVCSFFTFKLIYYTNLYLRALRCLWNTVLLIWKISCF